MPKILIIHGAGMNMRGKVQTEIFGPMTLPEYDERIRGYAAELGLEIEIFHSNLEGEVINKLYEANDRGFDAALFNPAGYSTGYPALVAAITGRLAPVAEEWLGIDPDQVVVGLHAGRSWGSSELTGYGADRRLRVSLPAGWLASVWACGLARVGRHLIVAVEEPGWPTARVLGLRAPGAEPEPLVVQGSPGDVPHWEAYER